MTAGTIERFEASFARRPRRRRPQWRRAWRALRRLLRDSSQTQNAFEVVAALDPDSAQRAFERMLAHPEGRRLFVERPRLLDHLADRDALARLPDGSLGRAYLAHIERWGLDPGKLIAIGRGYGGSTIDEGARWASERSTLAHDLQHVLTGYGADDLGEATLLWFSYGLERGRGTALLMLGAAWESRGRAGRGWWRYVWRAWRRGRRAGELGALPWEELLAEPLADVRRIAGIDAPELAHPDGVRVDPDAGR
jgi:ubiquinone biosynthesis protein COQ4